MVGKGTGHGAGRPKDGSGASNSRLASRKAKSKKGQTTFQDVSSQLLQEAITFVVDSESLISFSKTSDGGALVIYVKEGNEESKDYATSPDELDEALTDIALTFKM